MNHISTSADDRRQTYRLAIRHQSRFTFSLDGAEARDEAIHGITLIDISHEGLMATDNGHLVPGARVLLEVPLVGWREAEVRWIAENRAGCRFAKPLNLEELRLAAANSERLASECPVLAKAIANMPPMEPEIQLLIASSPPRHNRAWLFAAFLLGTLAILSFASSTWLLKYLG